jgi:quercetin dioxygenase-like cupin family protein
VKNYRLSIASAIATMRRMKTAKPIVLELPEGNIIPLRDARGAKVVCLEGSLWITLDQHRNDIVLQRGQSYEVPKNGITLVQAMGAARLSIEALGVTPQLAFTAPDLVRMAA